MFCETRVDTREDLGWYLHWWHSDLANIELRNTGRTGKEPHTQRYVCSLCGIGKIKCHLTEFVRSVSLAT